MISRRRWLLAALSLAACTDRSLLNAACTLPCHPERSRGATPTQKPYVFLYAMMDLYYKGSTPRLLQSFVPTPALNLGDLAFTYDNALAIAALLARGTAADLVRARVLGDSLLYAQQHDPFADGRLRSAYYVHPFVKSSGLPNFERGDAFDVGDNAWSGLALLHLYAKTGAKQYLTAAVAVGQWIYRNAADGRGSGGYTGGLTPGGKRIPWKSTEHNLDTYALFTMLAAHDSTADWSGRAAPALAFVDSMWNAAQGFYWIGSLDDGVSANKNPIPEDVQSWSYLATQRAAHAASIDWAAANVSATDAGFSGVSFSNADRSGVWFEGTAHMAAALLLRGAVGDAAKAASYLQNIASAEAKAPHADGYGIDAASKDGLRTGDGDRYFAALHVGATAWYALAARGSNPFVLV